MNDTEESGWVIEGDGCYWGGTSVTGAGFVVDIDKAVRFARYEDADKVKFWLLNPYAFALRTAQHVWVKP